MILNGNRTKTKKTTPNNEMQKMRIHKKIWIRREGKKCIVYLENFLTPYKVKEFFAS
jgi:hypothetical protein